MGLNLSTFFQSSNKEQFQTGQGQLDQPQTSRRLHQMVPQKCSKFQAELINWQTDSRCSPFCPTLTQQKGLRVSLVDYYVDLLPACYYLRRLLKPSTSLGVDLQQTCDMLTSAPASICIHLLYTLKHVCFATRSIN